VSSKREQRDRESGLTFSWRMAESSRTTVFVAVVLVGLLTALLMSTIKVRVVPPPRVIERKGTVMFVPEASEVGREWTLRAEEEGPFPARFDLSESPLVQQMQADLFRDPSGTVPYQIRLRGLPSSGRSGAADTTQKPEGVFPRTEGTERPQAAPSDQPLTPVLTVLSKVPAGALPLAYPDFTHPVIQEMASQPWQFMVEIDKDGVPIRCIALDGGEPDSATEKWLRGLEHWLCGVRFGAAASEVGWIGVEINFSRRS
jgi:hypothetical protein